MITQGARIIDFRVPFRRQQAHNKKRAIEDLLIDRYKYPRSDCDTGSIVNEALLMKRLRDLRLPR